MSYPIPTRRQDVDIAIICALPLEHNAIALLFDEFCDDDRNNFGKAAGDPNYYLTGRIGQHYVVLTVMSNIGKSHAASAAASLRSSYSNIRLALLVGVCGVAPQTCDGEDIFLGDVVVSKTVVQYDLGRRYPHKFIPRDTIDEILGRPNKAIRNLLVALETDTGRTQLRQKSASFLAQLQQKSGMKKKYGYPGLMEDKLFPANYIHKHYGSPTCSCKGDAGTESTCSEALTAPCYLTGCDEHYLLRRPLPENGSEGKKEPDIYFGCIASGDTVIKSAEAREIITQQQNAIAFEMEGAGVWDELPCVIIKGACDYADSHKNKKWQNYAAATAASVSKALLECYTKDDHEIYAFTGQW
ncbi:unnamed protein product [Clonostachys byssicola]|uniref:Nucleoside phosphorylase domain-containing protein n=1 Tax=Clonostachys byssicola TaxID=160290 RepID=A0A9N9XWE1_9HYPO|nr:unnamed protein product [Clonostachys byssicola]